MDKQIIYKVPGGKLLKIFLSYDESSNLIKDICITGDFFAYPEESVEELEKILKNKELDKKELMNIINLFVKDHGVEFIGIDSSTITDAILEGVL